MRALWKKFGKTEIAYTIPGLEETLAQVTNDKKYAADFFKKYIYGHDEIDYAPLLTNAGIELSRPGTGKAWEGNVVLTANKDNQLVIGSNTIKNTPLYNAGLDIDDIILSIDGKNITQRKEWEDVIAQHKINDAVEVTYKHRGETKKTTVTLKESPMLRATLKSNTTDSEVAFRNAWLGEK
jgi:predicted metalloprotease with PDZ domain